MVCSWFCSRNPSLPDVNHYFCPVEKDVKEIDAPISQFIKMSKKDKVISLIALTALLIIPRLGLRLNSGGINFLFLFLGFLAFGYIRSFSGRKELSNKGTQSQDNSPPKS